MAGDNGDNIRMDRLGGVILCGGESRRMGQCKANVLLGEEYLLQRVVRILSAIVQPLVVVAASGQRLPELPSDIKVLRDRVSGRGPLEGCFCGLQYLAEHSQWKNSNRDSLRFAYVQSVDCPFVTNEFVSALWRKAKLQPGNSRGRIVMPKGPSRIYPLNAIYPVMLHELAGKLLAAGERKMSALSKNAEVDWLNLADETKPEIMAALENVNSESDLQRAKRHLGENSSGGHAEG